MMNRLIPRMQQSTPVDGDVSAPTPVLTFQRPSRRPPIPDRRAQLNPDELQSTTMDAATPQQQQQQQQQQQTQALIGHDSLIRSRQEELEQLARDVALVNELFVDMALLVQEQSLTLENIETNVTATEVTTKQAVEQLRGAAKTQRRNRGLIAGIVTTALTAVGVMAVVGALKPRLFSLPS